MHNLRINYNKIYPYQNFYFPHSCLRPVCSAVKPIPAVEAGQDFTDSISWQPFQALELLYYSRFLPSNTRNFCMIQNELRIRNKIESGIPFLDIHYFSMHELLFTALPDLSMYNHSICAQVQELP